MMPEVYVGIPKGERNSLAAQRLWFKRRGLVLEPLRAELVWEVVHRLP